MQDYMKTSQPASSLCQPLPGLYYPERSRKSKCHNFGNERHPASQRAQTKVQEVQQHQDRGQEDASDRCYNLQEWKAMSPEKRKAVNALREKGKISTRARQDKQ